MTSNNPFEDFINEIQNDEIPIVEKRKPLAISQVYGFIGVGSFRGNEVSYVSRFMPTKTGDLVAVSLSKDINKAEMLPSKPKAQARWRKMIAWAIKLCPVLSYEAALMTSYKDVHIQLRGKWDDDAIRCAIADATSNELWGGISFDIGVRYHLVSEEDQSPPMIESEVVYAYTIMIEQLRAQYGDDGMWPSVPGIATSVMLFVNNKVELM